MKSASWVAQSRRRSNSNANAGAIGYELLEPKNLLAGFATQVGGGSGDLLINEIMYHPSSDNSLEEYIELHNTTGVTLDLQQWELTDGVQFTFPAVSIPAGGYLVVASDLASFQAKYPTITNVVGGWDGQLSNRSEEIKLEDDTGFDVNELTYADEGAWAERVRGPLILNHEGWEWGSAHDGGGSSLELRQAGLSNELGRNWGASTTLQGTPGEANSIATTDSAPLILDPSHSPAIPSASDTVTVSATVVDELNTGISVTAFFRVDGTAPFSQVPLFDDGNHNDGLANDGVFAAELPAQADGAIVEFYIEATDASANSSTLPSPSLPSGQQLTNFLYQVDDSFNANDPNAGSSFAGYRLIMTEAERLEIERIGDFTPETNSNAQMNGTFIAVNGSTIDVRYNVGIRNRGGGSRDDNPNSYRVNLPSDQPWQGFDALNINAQFPYLQQIGLQLYQEAGYESETGEIVSLLVNGEDLSLSGQPSFGQYIHVTPFNGDLLDQQFPGNSNGNLYRVRRDNSIGPADLQVLDSLEDYQALYSKNTNASENDYSDLIDLIQKLNDTPDETYLETIEQVVDIDSWVAYFAINAILGNRETSLATGQGDDYLLYSGDSDPRFKLLPHDFDSILGQGDTLGPATAGIYDATDSPTIERFLLHEAILPQYHAKLQQLLTTTFAKVAFDPLVEDALIDFLPANQINSLIDFMDRRRSFITGLIDGELTISSPLPVFNGFPRSTSGEAAVGGNASLAQTQSVLVNGQLASLDRASGVWTLGQLGNANTSTLVAPGSNWQFLDAGNVPSTAPGNDWRIDDPGWIDSGFAELGYGDPSVTTVEYIDTDPDTAGTQKNITTYFRKTFDLADASEVTGLTLNLMRDDGAIVFLNGEELLRDNLPSGTITSTTTATATVSDGDEDRFFPFTVDPTKLLSGQNIIAVEIHQQNDSSSDISFDLELLAAVGGTPSAGGVALVPGINRLVAESYSGPTGTGELIDSAYVDVWYDSGTTQSIGGPIETDTTLTVAGGPYVVTSDLIVRAGATLTIEPGVSVLFNDGVGLEVTDTGRIVAEGTESQRIMFTNNPATSNSWDGVRIVDTQSDNRFGYADFVAGADQGEALFVDHGRAVFDNVSWSGFQQQVMDLRHPTLVVSNSNIPGINGDETIHLVGLDPGEQFELIGNVIGKNTSGGDVVDVGHDTLTPQRVIIRGNIFHGGDDDGIDADGFPVLIENNVFHDFHANTSRATTANAVSTGRSDVDGQIVSSNLELIGNVFYDNDHHLLLKDFSSATLVNNTFVDATIAAFSLGEPNGSNVVGPGASLILDGNIVVGFPVLFEAREASTFVEINRSIVPDEFHSEGVGNIDADPNFNDPFNQDFSLRFGSPAIGTGPNGTNIGAIQANPLVAPQTDLRITEINYNPVESAPGLDDGDDFEFIELFNPSTTGSINLNGAQFADGVSLIFDDVELAPGERAVVVEDEVAFKARYGDSIRVLGQWSGGLSNGGEIIELLDSNLNEILSFEYGDGTDDPWYPSTDGGGFTLILDDPINTPVLELGQATRWRPNTEIGGTPGTAISLLDSPVIVSFVRDGGSEVRPDLWTTLDVTFSVDVAISASALQVVSDSTGGSLVDLSGVGFSYDSSNQTATWDFSTLPDLDAAFYTATLDASLVTAAVGGLSLDGDANGIGGDDFSDRVYVAIPGDANLDGMVNVLGDAFTLVSNLNSTGNVWTDGDFNADGTINVLGDAFTLIANLGRSVLPSAPPAIVSFVRDGGSEVRPDLWTTLDVTFSADVVVSASALQVVNDSAGGSLGDLSGIGFSYDSGNQTATWDFSTLPNFDAAFYTATLDTSLVTAAVGGLSLDGDGNGVGGDDYSDSVYVAIPGDANLDGTVNVLGDAFILISNLNSNGNVWTDGDFNADGNVNVLGDAFTLVANLGRSVLPPGLATSQFASSKAISPSPVIVQSTLKQNDSSKSKESPDAPLAESTAPVLAGSQQLDDAFASDDWLI